MRAAEATRNPREGEPSAVISNSPARKEQPRANAQRLSQMTRPGGKRIDVRGGSAALASLRAAVAQQQVTTVSRLTADGAATRRSGAGGRLKLRTGGIGVKAVASRRQKKDGESHRQRRGLSSPAAGLDFVAGGQLAEINDGDDDVRGDDARSRSYSRSRSRSRSHSRSRSRSRSRSPGRRSPSPSVPAVSLSLAERREQAREERLDAIVELRRWQVEQGFS
jgi:hypothetical protein